MGLPQGFNDLKNSLEMTMVDKLRFFIPTPFFEGFKDYNVTSKTIDTGFQYTLEDKTFLKDITKLEVFFNKENLLSKIEINGRETNIFTFDSTLADKKLLLKDLIIESGGSQGVFALSYSVEYQKINKYIFPKKIFISSQLQSSSKEGGQKQIFSEVKSEVIFSNFTVK
jgi:hypothetical protein